MALANLIDQITIGTISIATIDSDPTVNGYGASLGSFAQFTDNANMVYFYQKTGALDTQWTIFDLGLINLASQVFGVLPTTNGGTGVDAHTAAAGQVLIGNGSGFTLATLTAGNDVAITNGPGTITIASTFASVLQTDTITTTDNTVTTLSTIATTTNTTMQVSATVLGRRTGGIAAGNVGDSVSAQRTFTIKNIGGVVTLAQVQSDYTFTEGGLGGVQTPVISGTNVLLQVRGKASAIVDWKASDMILKVV
jgi:hypothetical protein